MQQQQAVGSGVPVVPDGAGRRARRLPRQWWVGYLFVAPAALLFAVVGL